MSLLIAALVYTAVAVIFAVPAKLG